MGKHLNLLRNLIEVALQQTELMFQAVEAEETKTLLHLLKSREAVLSRTDELMGGIGEVPTDITDKLGEMARLNQALLRRIQLKRNEITGMMRKNNIAGRMASKYEGGKGNGFPRFVDLNVG
ncbi:TPA: hypothetical protein EYP37_07635 [Candidatus Poribacteria bacterium]|nr:hypothetical protein [Candidatus Poribacteria bacterium]